MLLKIKQHDPAEKDIRQVVDILKKGGVVAYPTDTTYGIGCNVFDKNAIKRIDLIKNRPDNRRYSFICHSIESIDRYAVITDYSKTVLERFLPGPYTFILKGKKCICDNECSTVGIRVPESILCRVLVCKLGSPLITTSANISGEAAISEPALIAKKFSGQIDLIIDDGSIPPEPSSIIDLTSDKPRVLRKGKGKVSFFL